MNKLVLAALVLTVVATQAVAQQSRPNVVFILADNVGYGDLGSYGGGQLRGAPTPRLDQLAQRRVKTDAVPRRTSLHALPGSPHDGAVLDPQRPVADCD